MNNKRIFRYRIITNFDCNQNCSFCFQPIKDKLSLNINFMESIMKKVGKLERATIMGGESLLLTNIIDYFKITREYCDIMCLVTNGSLIDEYILKEFHKIGLEEIGISISSIKDYKTKFDRILLAKKYIPNVRINIPKNMEAIEDKLYKLIDIILSDNIGVVVCEDLMGRYNINYNSSFEDLSIGMKAKLIRTDGKNFFTFEWKGKEFGLFGHHGDPKVNHKDIKSGYEKTDMIICPSKTTEGFCGRVFSVWEHYCKFIGNNNLC